MRTTRYPIDRRAERIVAAALAEFARRGVRAARMTAVARRAGVSLATLRQYFPTRDDLLREVIRSTIVRLIAQPDRAAPLADEPVVARLRRFLREVWRTMDEPDHAALLRLAHGELSAYPELAVLHATEVIGRAIARLEAMLAEGMGRGELRRTDVRTLARVVAAAMVTYGLWLQSPGIYGELTGADRERAEEAAIEVIVGLLGRAPA